MTARSREERRDGQLAWLVVIACAIATLTLAGVGVRYLWRPAQEAAAAEWRRSLREAAARNEARRLATIPPNSAKPVGSPQRWIEPGNQPTVALGRGEHGVVRVTLAIDAHGLPTGCAVAQSSGFWALDNGTCLALMKAGRFQPARPGSLGAGLGEVRRWTSPVIIWERR